MSALLPARSSQPEPDIESGHAPTGKKGLIPSLTFKQVIGDGLRSRTDQRRATEVDIAVHALNRMLELGRPEYIRIA